MLCSPLTREYLINYARPLIYTTFMSYPSLVAIRTVYDLMIDGGTVAVGFILASVFPSITHADPARSAYVGASISPPRSSSRPFSITLERPPAHPTAPSRISYFLTAHTSATRFGEGVPGGRVYGARHSCTNCAGRRGEGKSLFTCRK